MREEAFRAFACRARDARTVDSYLSYNRRVERILALDLGATDLSETGINLIALRLKNAGVLASSISNCCSALRSYADFRRDGGLPGGGENDRRSKPVRAPRLVADTRPIAVRPAHITSATAHELLVLYCQIIDELRQRGVVRTGNSPVGDYAEMLFAKAFGWTLEANSASGHDATDHAGRRYQIKSRRVSPRSPSRQLGALRRLDEHTFDILAAIIFDEAFGVARAILIPHALVQTLAKRTDHTNSWRLMLSDNVWALPGVRDVTAELAAMSLSA